MGATFYVEPLLTFDLYVFVELPQTGTGLVSMTLLYETLRMQGYQPEAECVNIEGVPVQFLPIYNPLVEEAVVEARETLYEQTPMRVMRVEHLIALCLQTGREKDHQRVRVFREQAEIDVGYLAGVLARHHLEMQWKQWTS